MLSIRTQQNACTTSTSATCFHPPSRFLDLPPELRCKVYENGFFATVRQNWCQHYRESGYRPFVCYLRSLRAASRVLHISLVDPTSYDAFLEWIDTLGYERVVSTKELRIYVWLELWHFPVTLNFSTLAMTLHGTPNLEHIPGATEWKFLLQSAIIEQKNARQVHRIDCSYNMFTKLLKFLDHLSRSNGEGRFKVADIATIADTIYKHSAL